MRIELVGAETTAPSVFDVINLFSAATAIVLAVVALSLSVYFFNQSKRDAERSVAAANEISSSVSRLEKLFDSLYSDTFSMMRETVTDMRKHVWTAVPALPSGDEPSEPQTEPSEVDEQAAIMDQIAEVSKRIGIADAKIGELSNQLEPVLHRTLAGAAVDRAKREPSHRASIRQVVMARTRRGIPTTLSRLALAVHLEPDELIDDVFALGSQGVLDWNGAPNHIDLETEIRYVTSRGRESRRDGPTIEPGS